MTDENEQRQPLTVEVPAAYEAIWTPHAELLCGPCHGRVVLPAFGGRDERVIDTTTNKPTAKRLVEHHANGTIEHYVAQTTCTRCHDDIQGDCDAAHLRALDIEGMDLDIEGAELEQTGGMCAGLAIPWDDGRFSYVTCLDGGFMVTLYKCRDDFDEGNDLLACYETDDVSPESADELRDEIKDMSVRFLTPS